MVHFQVDQIETKLDAMQTQVREIANAVKVSLRV